MSLNLHIKYLDRAGLFFLFIVPFGLAFSRAAADSALVAVAVLFIIRSILLKDWKWMQRPDIACFLILWLFIVIGTSIVSNFERPIAIATIWGRFILFYAAATTWLLINAQHVRLVSFAVLGLACILIIDAYWQYHTGTSLSGMPIYGGYRLTGPLAHANIGNLILKLTLPALGVILYHHIVSQADAVKKYLIFALITSAIILIPLTGERSSTLLMVIAFFIICGLIVLKSKSLRRIAIACCLALTIVLTTLYLTQDVVQLRVWHVIYHFNKLTTNVYAELYKMSFFLWLENPILGHGTASFRELCTPENMTKFGITYCNIHPHNVYFEWLSDTGLIGLSLYLAGAVCCMIYFVSGALWRDYELLPSVFGLATIVILFWPFTVTQSIHSNWGAVLMWFSLSLAVSSTYVFRKS